MEVTANFFSCIFLFDISVANLATTTQPSCAVGQIPTYSSYSFYRFAVVLLITFLLGASLTSTCSLSKQRGLFMCCYTELTESALHKILMWLHLHPTHNKKNLNRSRFPFEIYGVLTRLWMLAIYVNSCLIWSYLCVDGNWFVTSADRSQLQICHSWCNCKLDSSDSIAYW